MIMNGSVGKGAIVLTISGFICKLFGALFRLPLTNIIGLEGISLFQMVMTIYSFALIFVSGGVTNSLSKLVSSARARGEQGVISSYLKYALYFTLVGSLVFGVIFILFAPAIASLQGATVGVNSYRLLALLLPLGALVGVARGLVQGYGNMIPTAVSQIIEQVIKFAFGLIFAYLFRHQGVAGGVFGALIGIAVSEIFACFYLLVKTNRLGKMSFSNVGKQEFFHACLPLTFGGIILPLVHTIEALFIVKLLVWSGLSEGVAKIIYGLQTGVVGAILNFPLIISLAVASALLPNLSFLAQRKADEKQKELITGAISVMWFLLVPLVVGIMALSKNVYPIIYPQAIEGYLDLAHQLTVINGFAIIATALMQLLVSILLANGHFKDSLVFYIIGGSIKVASLIAISFIPSIATFSMAISNFLIACIVSICIIIKLKKLIYMPFFEVLLPLLSSITMFFVVKILLSLIPSIWGIVFATAMGSVVYFVLSLPLTSKYAKILFSHLKKERNKFVK